MIELQVISKILETKNYFLDDSEEEITSDYFATYTKEFEFIQNHYKKYNSVPDKETFLSKFKEIEVLPEVFEDFDFLIDELKHNYLYNKMLPVYQQGIKLFNEGQILNSYDYFLSELPKTKEQIIKPDDVGVIESIDERITNYEFVNQNQFANFIPTGFDEIDNDIIGWQRGDEFVVIYARTNMGKSWILEAFGTNAVEQGYKVGYHSPEMSKQDIGYRFDTLHGHLSNSAMKFGKVTDDFNVDVYREYGENLKKLNGELFVSTPADFGRRLTVSKLKAWKERRKLDMILIDGITYLTDERYKKGDSKTISLTNISEDLMMASSELKIPIIVVVQANRGGILDKQSLDTPELENIRDSDGIAMNATKVYAVRQVRKDGIITLIIDNKKMRGAEMGQSYCYYWNIDEGKFEYVDKSTLDTGNDEYVEPKEKKKQTGSSRRKVRKTEEDEY